MLVCGGFTKSICMCECVLPIFESLTDEQIMIIISTTITSIGIKLKN